jgi:hypothetical protein
VREVRLHDGRHTAATLLLAEGVHPRVVMEVLGNAQMRDDHGHLQPCDAGPRPGRGGPDGASAVGVSRHRIGSHGHHGGTRNDSEGWTLYALTSNGRTCWNGWLGCEHD